MNSNYRKPLPGTGWITSTRAAVDAIQPGAWDKLPYTSRVHWPKTWCAAAIRPR
jgi:hypothetical protein